MAIKCAARGAIDPFIVMDMMRAAADREAEGENIIHMEVGQPSTPAPRGAIEAAHRGLEENRLGYCDALGLASLRARIATHYKEFYDVDVAPGRVVVTTGSSAGFLIATLAVFDHRDRVAMAAPGYPAYRNMLTALGVETVSVPSTAKDRFQLTRELVANIEGSVGGSVDGVIVASPSNPAGTVLEAQGLHDLYRYCDQSGIRMISDEIYHGINYGAAPVTAAVFENAIVINSFSKYFSMTGWRVGWLIVPEDLVRTVERLSQNLFISTPVLSQIAAEAAFDCHDELRGNVAAYARNRQILLEGLPVAGFDRLAPVDGAFYVYADVGGMTNDSTEFCHLMLREAGVAATPGIDFDPFRGNRFVRFCFSGTNEDTVEAVDRLVAWQKRRRARLTEARAD